MTESIIMNKEFSVKAVSEGDNVMFTCEKRPAVSRLSVNVDVSAVFIDETLETLTRLIARRKPDWIRYLSPRQKLLYDVVHKGRFSPYYNSMLNQAAPSGSPSLPSSANRLPMRTAWCDPYWLHVSETLPKRPSFHRRLNAVCGGAGHKRFLTHEATSGYKITEISIHAGIKRSALPPAHPEIWSNFSWNFALRLSKEFFELTLKEICNLPAVLQKLLACCALNPNPYFH